MRYEFFLEQMSRLNGLHFVPADLTTHWEALQELPEAVFEAAVTRAQRTRVDFPAPLELRQDADQAARRTAAPEPDAPALPAPVVLGTLPNGRAVTATRMWVYYCEVCSDSGWRTLWCGGGALPKPWLEHRTCDRRFEHAPHESIEACPCRESNPAVKRRKEREAKYAAKPGKALV